MRVKTGFRQLRVLCVIGDLPQERNKEQEILIDLEVVAEGYDGSDDLQKTVDYAALASFCSETAKREKFRLLERCGSALLEGVMSRFSLESAKIRIRKPEALADAGHAFVEMEVDRS